MATNYRVISMLQLNRFINRPYFYLTGRNFYLLEAGVRRCPTGFEVRRTAECEEACDQLDISASGRKFKNGKPCYKGGSGVCNQNGGFTRRSSLICKHNGNPMYKVILTV